MASFPIRRVSQARLGGAVVGLFLPLAFASPASADEPTKADLSRARSAFQEGVALAAANNCAAALVKYKEVAQVKMTPQVAFNTAECEARLGRLVAALGNYRVAASQAADDKKAAAVLREAPARVDELEARIPKLTITRGKGADTAAIFLDDTEISQLGSAIPVDPGSHTIVAKVGGKEYLHETLKLEEKQAKTFDVVVNAPTAVVEKPVFDTPKPPPPPVDTTSRKAGIGLTVGGGILMVAGFAMLAPRGSALSTLNQECQAPVNGVRHCPSTDSASSVNTFTGLTAGFVTVGGLAAITGIVLWVRSPSAPGSSDDAKDAFVRSLRVAPSLGSLGTKDGAGAVVTGSF